MTLSPPALGVRLLLFGTWRSPVAHLNGVQGVAGSNPAVPIYIGSTAHLRMGRRAIRIPGRGIPRSLPVSPRKVLPMPGTTQSHRPPPSRDGGPRASRHGQGWAGRRRTPAGVTWLAVALGLGLGACTSDPVGLDPDLPIPCDPETAPVLPVGGFQQARGAASSELCLKAPPGGGEYVLVGFSGATPSTSSVRVHFSGENLVPALGPPSPSPARHAHDGVDLRQDVPTRDSGFDAGIRRRERQELLARVGPPGAPRPQLVPGLSPSGVPAVGSLLTLNAQSGSACEDPINRTARVMAISERALVVADTLNPSGGFTLQDYEHLATVFDTLVVPVTDEHFGRPSDLDGNGRTILFFTREVNRLTEEGADRFVGGFFFARDLFPRTRTTRLNECATSNEGEILYLMVPEPGRTPDNVWGRSAVLRNTPSTMAHEQQHLINAARRLHVLQSATPFEDTWLNEGLSHSAEELLFYRASGLDPGNNLALSDLQAGGRRVLDAVNAHHLSNILRFERFLRAPHEHSPYDEDDSLEARGAAHQFLRYAADRRNGLDAEFFRSLVDAPNAGVQNLAERLGGESALQEWLADWSVAVYADSRVPNLDRRHHLLSWSHPSLFQQLQIRPYPIRTLSLSAEDPVEVELVGGGSAHLRFGVEEGEGATLRITVGDTPPSSSFRVTLLRTR